MNCEYSILFLPEVLTKYDVCVSINEALFDDGQLTKKQDISVDDSDNEVLEFEEQTLE